MKNRNAIIFILFLTLILFSNNASPSYAGTLTDTRLEEINNDFKGLWVATVLNLDYPSKATTDSATLKKEAIEILDKAQIMGINAIVLQVRPSADALYQSKIYPWSKYLTGKQGVAPSDDFDPLKFWIDEAHKRNIALHAWLNPYRITRKNGSEPSYDYSSLASNHPAKLHPQWVVEHTDGNLYFNPGLPEVREHIVESIMEIVSNYDVDGIHFDDYFYPSTSFNDGDAYKKYGANFNSLSDWRRNNVDALINDVYTAIKEEKPQVRFGVSPFGIWANAKNNKEGSDTNGFESYYSQYADTKKWLQTNMVDYLAPQLYWNIGYNAADYSKLVAWWADAAKDSKANLYIGQAAYRVGDKDVTSPWYGVDEISRQLTLNKSYAQIKGSIYFRYAFFKDNMDLSNLLTVHNNSNGIGSVQKLLVIGRPVKDVTTTSSFYFIGGASDVNYPVYLNGEEIRIRTMSGYFGTYVPLKNGVNTFVISQNGKKVTRKITRVSKSTTQASPMTKPEIITGSTWPQTATMISTDEELKFYCRAPIGATVTATLAGKTYNLIPNTKSTTSTALYSTSYSLRIKAPVQSGSAKIVDLGKPIYKMSYKGTVDTETGNVNVKIAMEGAPLVAIVNDEFINSYESATTSNGAHFILQKGMKDYITGENGDYTRLSSGIWVKTNDISVSNSTLSKNVINKISTSNTSKKEEIYFDMSQQVVSSVDYDGKFVEISFANTYKIPEFSSQNSSLIKSSEHIAENSLMKVRFEISNPESLAGYYMENTTKGVKLVLKKKFAAYSVNPNFPLEGAVIMIDPGHGGTDSGAIGLLGTLYTEKGVVLDYSFYLKAILEGLGADVIMTRDQNIYVSLDSRLMLSRAESPDLFISIHADSLDDSADISKVRGFTIYYKDPIAKAFANSLKETISSKHAIVNRGVKNMNFYVVRGTWTPSVLIETGFMPNPSDFQWLTDAYEQEMFAKTIGETIVKYFSQSN
ncbi:family 10 glycosylhydrolase [Fusibacter bizertensis]|uniref:Family 10 glycosylhydrolase n=1 Tax=Fusibacter bizertensis TaxID=1488331 RepID=A0ABT6ND24_9FIRM|nr:N-acetylmuramoyl-L-alanine amidase [Fusibacter bizertensis]MDH8678319.1 family 10 glycosylhydrolase [Fusibacter bizertensis]